MPSDPLHVAPSNTQGDASTETLDSSCWICFGECDATAVLCRCPARVAHPLCLSKWQLTRVGTSEETHCRFCNEPLPCWKNALFPGTNPPANPKPILRVGIRGVDYYIEPKPGKEGLEEFKRTLRSFCELDEEADFDMSFGCSLPDPAGGKSSTISLQGLAAYEALIQMAMNHKSYAALPALAARLEMSTEDDRPVSQRPSPSGGESNPLRSRGREAPREEGIRRRDRDAGHGFASRMKKLLFANLSLPGAN